MKKAIFVLVFIIVLSGVFAAVEAKPSRMVEEHVFIHRAKPDKPKPGGGNGGGGKLWYRNSGLFWAETQVRYTVDLDGSGLDPAAAFEAIVASFETWDSETEATELFGVGGEGEALAGKLDGKNGISFGDYPSAGVIAVTYIWYWGDTGEIVEVDTLFDVDYDWSLTGEKGKMDLSNIATHEFGHWLVLDDLYNKPAREQTMYGYSTYGETKKRTLESGDIAGLEEIYGP